MSNNDSDVSLRAQGASRRKPAKHTPAPQESGRRMSPSQREDVIVKEAVKFFAEFGFEGQTRELARRLGITQPLLYRYFATKDALVERVYQEVFLRRWNPFWDELIVDRSRPLRERLVTFYQDYARVILTYEWVRLFMFSGLKGLDFNTRYLDLLRRRVFTILISEFRHEFGRPPIETTPVTEMEVEAVWSLHAAIFYLGVRKFIYDMPVGPLEPIIEMKVRSFVDGIGAALA